MDGPKKLTRTGTTRLGGRSKKNPATLRSAQRRSPGQAATPPTQQVAQTPEAGTSPTPTAEAISVPPSQPPTQAPTRAPYEPTQYDFGDLGEIVVVECPLYPGLKVGYRVDNPWRIVNGPVKNDDGMGMFRRLRYIVRFFEGEWPFRDPLTEEEYPKPDPNNLYTWALLYHYAPRLGEWLWEGYRAALDQRIEEKFGGN